MKSRNIKTLADVPESIRGCVLTLGNFDGVHLGHRQLIDTAVSAAKRANTVSVAMTFDPPPNVFLRPDSQLERISLPDQRATMLHNAGIDYVVTIVPELSILHMEPAEFLDEIIVKTFAPSHIVEGTNFHFGSDRSGSVDTLKRMAASRDWGVDIVSPMSVMLDGSQTRVSSTMIRKLIKSGRMEDANRFLGHMFTLIGTVVHGDGIGKTLNFPTANLNATGQILPADGVYAGEVEIDNKTFPAAISIGKKPTFDGQTRIVEAHIPGIQEELYDQNMNILFFRKLRDQQKFDDIESLKKQIKKDIEDTLGTSSNI